MKTFFNIIYAYWDSFYTDMVVGKVGYGDEWGVGWVLSWYVHHRPSLADFFLYLAGIDFLQDAEAARRPRITDDDSSCSGGDP